METAPITAWTFVAIDPVSGVVGFVGNEKYASF